MEMLHAADCAWHGLMKDKMKAVLEKERGDKMNKVAELSVQASIEFWTKKMAGEEPSDDFFKELETKLNEAMKG